MSAKYYTILTEVGKTKVANAAALGRQIKLTQLAVGDGNGVEYDPVESQTDLKKETYRTPISHLGTDAQNPNWVIAEGMIPVDVGGWFVREVGLFDEDGDLFAVGKYPETYKPTLAEGTGRDLYIRFIMVVSNTESIDLKIDPTVAIATRGFVEEMVSELDANNITSNNTGGHIYENFGMQELHQTGNYVLSRGTTATMVIGDSITTGVGAQHVEDKYVSKFYRSLWNYTDKGLGNDRVYDHESYIEMSQAIAERGISTDGTIVSEGVVQSRLKLDDGQHITVTLREIVYFDCIYNGASTTGDLEFYLNDVLVKTAVTDKTEGLKNTFPTIIKSGQLTSLDDECKIVAKGGSVVLTALLTYKQSYLSPTGFVVSKSGWAYQSFLTNEKLDEIAHYLNFFRESSTKMVVLNLGTNNIYNPGMSVTPDEYINLLNQMITGINQRVSNVNYVVAVPPRAVESSWPSTKGQYFEYVEKILDYCRTNKHLVTRFDRTTMSLTGDHYTDGVHPDNGGHHFMAMKLCETLGIPFEPYRRTNQVTDPEYLKLLERDRPRSTPMTLRSGWQSFLNFNKHTSIYLSGKASLTGIIAPDSNPGKDLAVIGDNASFPLGREVYTVAESNLGPIGIKIGGTGNVEIENSDISKIPTITWISLENVSYYVSQEY